METGYKVSGATNNAGSFLAWLFLLKRRQDKEEKGKRAVERDCPHEVRGR